MTNQNNAAQPSIDLALQMLGPLACLVQPPGSGSSQGFTIPCATVRGVLEPVIEMLSKLRAPVADERAQHDNWYSRTHMHEYSRDATWRGWQARAALASAPADEPPECPTYVCQAAQADGVLCANDECDRASGVRPASAPVAGEAVACLRRQREGSDWGHWTPATVEDGQRVTGLRSWQVRWLVDATPEAIADGLTVEIRLPNGTNISGWMKMASQAHLSAAPVECPPVAGERAFQLVQDLRAFAAMQRWFGEHGYDSVGASGRLAVSNALFARLCAALSAQPAEKPATSAPSPAASQRQAMVPGSQESGNSHTDGGAVYA
ncbi:hypothetical protein [Achromobacter denitrificans]|uniref:hypothetical protein n=1 Tax=Achromobacter denitrificans TaxID=32002 RepID=UPI00242BA425|nr:hypothetical protein [Achromobacter denitrificans]MBV2161454.1 hypothetical protein [Achromobacter denitrificans]